MPHITVLYLSVVSTHLARGALFPTGSPVVWLLVKPRLDAVDDAEIGVLVCPDVLTKSLVADVLLAVLRLTVLEVALVGPLLRQLRYLVTPSLHAQHPLITGILGMS